MFKIKNSPMTRIDLENCRSTNKNTITTIKKKKKALGNKGKNDK